MNVHPLPYNITATESDRSLIDHALSVAGQLSVGTEPTDSARFCLVELSKRLHLKMLEATTPQSPDATPGYDAIHVVIAVVFGIVIGAFLTWAAWQVGAYLPA